MKTIPYHELQRHFKQPNNWSIATTSHRYTGKIPRKLKKQIKSFVYWMYQNSINPNYNRFLIKLICQSTNQN